MQTGTPMRLALAPAPLARTRRARTSRRLLSDTRGATIVEYALILTLVMVAASPLLKSVGAKVKTSFQAATAGFTP